MKTIDKITYETVKKIFTSIYLKMVIEKHPNDLPF